MAHLQSGRAEDEYRIAASSVTLQAGMVHLIKLSVGIRDVEHLRLVQRERAETEPPLRHRTRQSPKRAAEIINGGSIFWVIGGMIQCRQRILDIQPDRRPDGTACAALILDRTVVLVDGRPVKPFQGWRYLNRNDAPNDLGAEEGSDKGLPSGLRLALRELCLL
jgi:hypothetical protein